MIPKLIIFDLDGLMLDTEELYSRMYVQSCIEQNIIPDIAVHNKAIGQSSESEIELYRQAHPDADPELLLSEIYKKSEEHFVRGEVTVKPGLFELFDAIDKQGGIKKVVGTSQLRETAEGLLHTTGIYPRLDGGVYVDMVKNGKPAPDIFALCCEQLGVAPLEALVLEDSEPGIQAALSAGIPVIAIPDLVEPAENILNRCLARCDSLFDVIALLEL